MSKPGLRSRFKIRRFFPSPQIKFGHSKENTKFEKNLALKIWRCWVTSDFKGNIFSNFVFISEFPNFNSWINYLYSSSSTQVWVLQVEGSSDPSLQSWVPSHFQIIGIQSPFKHLNCEAGQLCEEQFFSSDPSAIGQIFSLCNYDLMTKNQYFTTSSFEIF